MRRTSILLVLMVLGGWPNSLGAREWSDAEGRFLVSGEAFATNQDMVVVKKPDGDLVAIRINELSAEDQEFLRRREAERRPPADEPLPPRLDADPPDAEPEERIQTWTSRDGHELRGHAVGFGRREIVISRGARVISVNGIAFTNLDPISRYVVLQIVAELDDPTVKTERDLNEWVRKQGGVPRAFTIEGVLLRLEDGTNVPVPFFVFSEQELSTLRPGWEQWKSEQASETERQREDFLLEVQAREYQLSRQAEVQRAQQIQMIQMELLAAGAGLTTIWEVHLYPAPGTFARPLWIRVSARDSLQAQQFALARFPGYVAGPVRAVTR